VSPSQPFLRVLEKEKLAGLDGDVELGLKFEGCFILGKCIPGRLEVRKVCFKLKIKDRSFNAIRWERFEHIH
jgi:hypothetical protein